MATKTYFQQQGETFNFNKVLIHNTSPLPTHNNVKNNGKTLTRI